MDNLATYAETNSLLWKLRIETNREHNDIGHDFIVRIQRRIEQAVGELFDEE